MSEGRKQKNRLQRSEAFRVFAWASTNWDSMKTITAARAAERCAAELGITIDAKTLKSVLRDGGREFPGVRLIKPAGDPTRNDGTGREYRTRVAFKMIVRLAAEVEKISTSLGMKFDEAGRIDLDLARRLAGLPPKTPPA